LRLFSFGQGPPWFGDYGLALAALALVVFGAIECPPKRTTSVRDVDSLQDTAGSCHKRQKAQAPTLQAPTLQAPTLQAPIPNRQTRKVTNTKVRNRHGWHR